MRELTKRGKHPRGLTFVSVAVIAAAVAMVGCGDDEEPASQTSAAAETASITPETAQANLEAAGYSVEEKEPVADAGLNFEPTDTLTIQLHEEDTGLAELDFYADPAQAETAYADSAKLDDERFASAVQDTRAYVCSCFGADLDAQAILDQIVAAAEGG